MAKRIKPDPWAADLEIAASFAPKWGLSLTKATAEYQVAKLIGDDVRIVIYPHRTSAGHYHLRTRDEGSKNARRCQALMALLDREAGFNCTFSSHGNTNRLAYTMAMDAITGPGRLRVEAEAAGGALARPTGSEAPGGQQ